MKDRLFEGSDVEAALARAAADLGLARAALRFVVLEAGGPDGPARVAVMLDATTRAAAPGGAGAGPRQPPRSRAQAASEPRGAGVPGRVRRVVRELAEAADLELGCQVEDDDDRLVVRLSGPGLAPLLAEGGQPLRALEHLLQRMFNRSVEPSRVVVEGEGYREARDAWLAARALELARAVLGDGVPRETEPLNAYERRVIHVALDAVPGVHTVSVGSGLDRRVTVAPDAAGPASNPELM
jgi:spoIIIJ-associated protein